MFRRSLPWLLVVCVAAAAGGAFLARMLTQEAPPLQGGTWLPEPRALGSYALRGPGDAPFGPAQLAGAPSLLFLGFTYCPDVCPTTLATLRELMRAPPIAGLRVLFLTVDPDRDDAGKLRDYVAAFDPAFIPLRAPDSTLAPFLHQLGALAVRQPLPGGGYTVDHTATLYLLDAHGRIAALFTPPFTADALRTDLARIGASGLLH